MANGFTDDPDKRWSWLATIASLILVLSLVVLVVGGSFGLLTLSAIPQGWYLLYSSTVVTSVVWLFGKEAFQRWRTGK